ncbi:DNA alkylation repair protein [Bergeyella zoohelcum]|uniref:DNA alkylation repair enzyme n=1 Tax=Bergeyella zoohelcum TaxID=1015 RepID=A0A7Z8YMN5_9FLAO|nr:DNA alkylation repair protein [Bergeyella zoohelcum]VDH02698.1 DNA alkylation repair enzyme [Bergeyella zoohelcum]
MGSVDFRIIDEALRAVASEEKKEVYSRFFKAGKGEYAEGDLFIGVTVPLQRKIAKEFQKNITLKTIADLLNSEYHEHRHIAGIFLVEKFGKEKNRENRKEIVDFYLAHKERWNNWDLVDNTVYKILGRYALEENQPKILEQLSMEDNLWSKRMGVVGTMYFVKRGQFDLMEKLVLINIQHPHDLMHKANGWLLREMGQKNEKRLYEFLEKHYSKLPRTTLRYAIEKFSPWVRQDILKGIFR